MASHRMFSARITESTRFLKMPATSQNLYFHLGMKADDDGVVEAYPVMCTTGSTEDDLRVLVSKNFVTILNDDTVTYINDWREHNYIRADRKKDSIYKDLLLKVVPDVEIVEAKESYYSRKNRICQTNDGQRMDKCQQNDRLSKDKISKDKVSEDKISEDNEYIICPELEAPERTTVITLTLNDRTEHPVYQEDIDEWNELYPAVDILQELRKMKGWLNANPTKRKTKRGIGRFINNWLSREQDKGGSKPVAEESPAEKRERERQANLAQWDEEQKNRKFHVPPVAPEDAAF